MFVTNTAGNTVRSSTPEGQGRPDHRHPAVGRASVGYEPNAITLTDDDHLLVTLGRANAVAVYKYTSPQEPVSYVGLLPTDYFPAEIATVGNRCSSPTPAASTPAVHHPRRARHPRHHVEPAAVHAADDKAIKT